MQKVLNAIQRVRFTKSTPRQASIRCKAVDKCLFPHHEVVDNQTQKAKERLLFPQKKRKRRQECSGYCEKLYHNWVASRKTGMRWFSMRQTVPMKPDASTVHSVRTIAWGKYKSNLSTSAKSLRYEIRGSVPRRD